jgi:hypothetical protein
LIDSLAEPVDSLADLLEAGVRLRAKLLDFRADLLYIVVKSVDGLAVFFNLRLDPDEYAFLGIAFGRHWLAPCFGGGSHCHKMGCPESVVD